MNPYLEQLQFWNQVDRRYERDDKHIGFMGLLNRDGDRLVVCPISFNGFSFIPARGCKPRANSTKSYE